jgi:hypothetical protein
MVWRSRSAASLLFAVIAAVGVWRVAAAPTITVSRAQFAQYVGSLSEPEGYFDTDNFISNETSYLHVVPELKRVVKPGNVYLGVGPDQNFPYITHTQPALAIVVDIRRQNMLQHLLYKALFEVSASRSEFLAMLLSREPVKIDSRASLQDLLIAVRRSPASEARYQANRAAIRKKISEFGVRLDGEDFRKIDYVHRTFHEEGLDLRFSSIGRNNAANYPTFQNLLLQTDKSGKAQGYLASEELFLWMKRFETENRLIPVVGDFAGSKAFKAVGAFLRRSNMQVSTFYTSNVEFYLVQNDEWRDYIDNVRSLPVTPDAVFIRAYFGTAGPLHPQNVPGHRSTTLVQSLTALLRDQAAGRIRTYWDVVGR